MYSSVRWERPQPASRSWTFVAQMQERLIAAAHRTPSFLICSGKGELLPSCPRTGVIQKATSYIQHRAAVRAATGFRCSAQPSSEAQRRD
jgi:uncharacterized C2H2 Zn-finger protein